MRHLRKDFETIQPWPIKRAHTVKNIHTGELETMPDEPLLPIAASGFKPVIDYDEPVFVLRGKDPSASMAVRAWADDAERLGADPELVRAVRNWANEMTQYANKHNPEWTVADVPDGMLRG